MTEQVVNTAIEKIAKNYNQLEQSLVNQLRLEVPNHQLTVGTYRERVWKSLFEMIIPKKYCIEQSVFIIFVIPFASLKAQTSYEKMLYLSTI